jgi:hypothetical protein
MEFHTIYLVLICPIFCSCDLLNVYKYDELKNLMNSSKLGSRRSEECL